VQGHVGGSRWLRFGSFQGYLFRLKISSVRFKVASTVQGHVGGWFGSFGFIWFKAASLLILMSMFGTRLLRRFKVASVSFGSVQDSFGSVQGCFSLVRFGSRLFQLFKVALVVQGCFVSVRSCRWFKVASLRFGSFPVSRVFVSVKDFFGSVQGCFYGSRSGRRLVRFLRFHLVQGCFTSNTHVGAVQGRQLLLFRSGALLWCKRDL
jgi:hypothetical protein